MATSATDWGRAVVTRALATALPQSVALVATDLNPPMLARAAAVGTSRPVQWQQADALQLPFDDGRFELVVCQFGAMFFPDKPRAFAEARRVLRRGGTLLFNVWDRIEANEFADTVTQALAVRYPEDPPRFMARTPHGYFERTAIEADLRAGGWRETVHVQTLAARSRAGSALVVARAYCEGTPLRGEIEVRSAGDLVGATAACAEALAARFGRGAVDGQIQAHVVAVRKDT